MESPYAQSSETPPQCIAFADIRGDFKLLFTLLTQIFQVAKIEQQKWTWTVKDTTLVCLGNFTDRFSKKGYNRLNLTTEFAIQDQIRIIETFQQLADSGKDANQNNNMVVLMGDHELGNLMNWSEYNIFQMADPSAEKDQKQHREFVETVLQPFCVQQGLVASWGLPDMTVYFSHGSLERDWFYKVRPDSLIDLNRKWQRWLKQNNLLRLAPFAASNSPIMSNKMAVNPQIWRDTDEEDILKILGIDPNARFVQAGMPVQILSHETWDPYMRRWPLKHKESALMLVSHSPDYLEQMYFIHNAMADVFCTYEAEDRRPQGLRFRLVMNNNGSALYLEANALSMSTEEYIVYMSERPEFSCKAPGTLLSPEEIKLTDDETLYLKGYSKDPSLKKIEHITEIGLVLFSADLKQLYVVQQWENPTHWSIPHGRRYPEETDWETLRRLEKEQFGLKDGLKFLDGGGFYDQDKTRIWLKQTRQNIDFQPNQAYQNGMWIEYNQLGSDKYIFLDRPARSMIQFLANHKHIPPLIKESDSSNDYQRKFDDWLKQHPNKKISINQIASK